MARTFITLEKNGSILQDLRKENRMTKHFDLRVPPTNDQGSYTAVISVEPNETRSAAALQSYNSARDHDGQPPLKRMPRGTEYIPHSVYVIQQYTGRLYGWEDVTQAPTRPEALQYLREYRENQPEYPARMIHRYI